MLPGTQQANAKDVPFGDATTIDGSFEGAISVYAADVDGDGDLDVLGAAYGADDISWWENTAGNGTAWTEHIVDSDFDGAESVHAADVDGDGDLDVLGAAAGAYDITWWENTTGNGTVWTEHTVDGDFGGAYSVYAADIDGDGDLDVLGAGDLHGAHKMGLTIDNVSWWENTDSNGTAWTKHTVDGDFKEVRSVLAVDLDGDGDLDVLGAACATFGAKNIIWWENTDSNGTAWKVHIVDGDRSGAWSVHAADVDGDGDLDVLGADSGADNITWWENTAGNGTAWTEHTVDGSYDTARSVYAADLDGDGDIDVLGADYTTSDITWWENTAGKGTVWTEHTVDGDFRGAYSVHAADVDGDGDLDILGAAYNAHDITWWKNR